jgi:hypothetical protein
VVGFVMTHTTSVLKSKQLLLSLLTAVTLFACQLSRPIVVEQPHLNHHNKSNNNRPISIALNWDNNNSTAIKRYLVDRDWTSVKLIITTTAATPQEVLNKTFEGASIVYLKNRPNVVAPLTGVTVNTDYTVKIEFYSGTNKLKTLNKTPVKFIAGVNTITGFTEVNETTARITPAAYTPTQASLAAKMVTFSGEAPPTTGTTTPNIIDGTAAASRYDTPREVSVTKSGVVYTLNLNNTVLRKTNPDGSSQTLTVTGFQTSPDPLTRQILSNITRMCLSSDDNFLYLLNGTGPNFIYRVSLGTSFDYSVRTIYDGAVAFTGFDTDAPTDIQSFRSSVGNDYVLVSTTSGKIHRFLVGGTFLTKDVTFNAATGAITTFAVENENLFYLLNNNNIIKFNLTAGAIFAAGLTGATTLTFDSLLKRLYVSEQATHLISAFNTIDAAPNREIVLGATGVAGYVNGAGNAVRLRSPQSMAIGSTGELLIADSGNNVIRRLR